MSRYEFHVPPVRTWPAEWWANYRHLCDRYFWPYAPGAVIPYGLRRDMLAELRGDQPCAILVPRETVSDGGAGA
jgi:hypothetical protein